METLLYVTRPLPVHLGQVVNGFKTGCNRKWRQLQESTWQQAGQQAQRQSRWAPDQKPETTVATGSVPGGSVARKKSGFLWEQGYHDRVLSGQGQLQRLVDYIRENPRRSLIKRQHASWFRPFSVTAAGTTLQAVGNPQLLQAVGRLLLLTPYPYSTQKVVLTRSVCNYLNVLAARLAE